MDKNLRNSLLFGAAVGGIFAATRRTSEKQRLTTEQLQSVNDLAATFATLQRSLEHLSLVPVSAAITESAAGTRYEEIVSRLEEDVQEDAKTLGTVKLFKSKLQYLLSGRFTEQRNNVKAHECQMLFSPLEALPDILISLLEKRTQILRLAQKGFRYMQSGATGAFKPEDTELLGTYMSEFKASEKQAESLLSGFTPA